jgi:uncharacterized membrane protein YkvA (DUF1232 family)
MWPMVLRPRRLWRFFRDKKAPLLPKIGLGLALLYFVFPFDVIPDPIPLIGYLDDLGVLAIAMAWLNRAVAKHAEIDDVLYGKLPAPQEK